MDEPAGPQCADVVGELSAIEGAFGAADDRALAAVEAVIAAQRDCHIPLWQPCTDFSWPGRRDQELTQAARLIEAFHPQRVVDVGCGPRHLVRALITQGWKGQYVGFDRSDGFDIANPLPITDGTITVQAKEADLVVCREVLEHMTLQDVRIAVTHLCALSARFVYVTTRFAKHATHLFDVAQSDDLDPTHITMLTQPMLRYLFVLEGFKRRTDLEAVMDWMKKGRVLVYERAA